MELGLLSPGQVKQEGRSLGWRSLMVRLHKRGGAGLKGLDGPRPCACLGPAREGRPPPVSRRTLLHSNAPEVAIR